MNNVRGRIVAYPRFSVDLLFIKNGFQKNYITRFMIKAKLNPDNVSTAFIVQAC